MAACGAQWGAPLIRVGAPVASPRRRANCGVAPHLSSSSSGGDGAAETLPLLVAAGVIVAAYLQEGGALLGAPLPQEGAPHRLGALPIGAPHLPGAPQRPTVGTETETIGKGAPLLQGIIRAAAAA